MTIDRFYRSHAVILGCKIGDIFLSFTGDSSHILSLLKSVLGHPSYVLHSNALDVYIYTPFTDKREITLSNSPEYVRTLG